MESNNNYGPAIHPRLSVLSVFALLLGIIAVLCVPSAFVFFVCLSDRFMETALYISWILIAIGLLCSVCSFLLGFTSLFLLLCRDDLRGLPRSVCGIILSVLSVPCLLYLALLYL